MSIRVDVYCPAIQHPDNVYVLGAYLSDIIPGDDDRTPVAAELAEFGCSTIGGGAAPSFLLIKTDAPAATEPAIGLRAALEGAVKTFLMDPVKQATGIRRSRLRAYAALIAHDHS